MYVAQRFAPMLPFVSLSTRPARLQVWQIFPIKKLSLFTSTTLIYNLNTKANKSNLLPVNY